MFCEGISGFSRIPDIIQKFFRIPGEVQTNEKDQKLTSTSPENTERVDLLLLCMSSLQKTMGGCTTYLVFVSVNKVPPPFLAVPNNL